MRNPYIDGNDRTGKLFMSLDLVRNGFLPINIMYTGRKRYYDVFDSCCDNDGGATINLIAGYADMLLDGYSDILTAK